MQNQLSFITLLLLHSGSSFTLPPPFRHTFSSISSTLISKHPTSQLSLFPFLFSYVKRTLSHFITYGLTHRSQPFFGTFLSHPTTTATASKQARPESESGFVFLRYVGKTGGFNESIENTAALLVFLQGMYRKQGSRKGERGRVITTSRTQGAKVE
ncbi:MAG: hypothetical protein J3R72DRAFT_90611 [Linnemannia gamsii]|nr:MAG: hypothetical protein J3R72DRAFT_90611 [Linnemannia gamsii]